MSANEKFWMGVGFAGQIIFASRFIIQWIASEKKGESVVPIAFWYLSLCGGWVILMYAFQKRDYPIMCGQLPGVIVYARNLVLIHRTRARDAAKAKLAQEPHSQILELPKQDRMKKAG